MEPSDLFNVRAYALEQAVKLHASDGPAPLSTVRNSEIIETARRFEQYLGEKPSGLLQHAEKPQPLAETIS